MEKNALITTLEAPATLAEYKKVCPLFCDPQTLARIAVTQLNRTPKLALVAGQNPSGFFSALMDCAQTGLIPDGRHAHLVPYGGKSPTVQFIPDWKGLVMLGMQSPNVARWRPDMVCERDDFVYNKGRIEKHIIDVFKPRGEVVGYYSELVYKDGTEDVEFITLNEAQSIKDRSQAGGDGPWVTDFHEMGKKTAVKRHAKRLSHILNKNFELAINLDADRLPEIDVTAHVESDAPSGTAAEILDMGKPKQLKKGRPVGSKNKPNVVEPEPAPEPEPTTPVEDEIPMEDQPPAITPRLEFEARIEKALTKKGAMASDTFLDSWNLTRMNWREASDEYIEEIAGAC